MEGQVVDPGAEIHILWIGLPDDPHPEEFFIESTRARKVDHAQRQVAETSMEWNRHRDNSFIVEPMNILYSRETDGRASMANRLRPKRRQSWYDQAAGLEIGICRSDDLLIMKDFGPTQDLAKRTKEFALAILKLSGGLPKTSEARVLGRQIVRSGTSVAANYRAVCRARSHAEFIAKLGTVVEEADETVFWLELLIESGISQEGRTIALLREAKELLAIFSASRRTAKSGKHSTDR